MRKSLVIAALILFVQADWLAEQRIERARIWPTQGTAPSVFDTAFFVAPLYVTYLTDSDAKFTAEVRRLRERLPEEPHVRVGFAAFLYVPFPEVDIRSPLTAADMAPAVEAVDKLVDRARRHGIPLHISIVSGFFHNWNAMRAAAIQQDVRNAQWFADGWIGPPEELKDNEPLPHTVWTTPSRNAFPLRARIEEGMRIVASRIAHHMASSPDTLLTVSGDGEVELTYERNFASSGEKFGSLKEPVYGDYSPFAVAEFRDQMRARYPGDASPATDDDRDGRTFNGEFGQDFTTWLLRYYEDSKPIPLAAYMKAPGTLPTAGTDFLAGGFDAPRGERLGDRYWDEWRVFRRDMVRNFVIDFAQWVTTSPDPDTGFRIPPERFFSHQIPGDHLLGDPDSLRMKTSASDIGTAVIEPWGSTGATVFNGFDGRRHRPTASAPLFDLLSNSSRHWGVLEYNPSIPYDNKIPPGDDLNYYLDELRLLYRYRPKVIVPFAWSEVAEHARFNIRGARFEEALRIWLREAGGKPWTTRGESGAGSGDARSAIGN